MAEKSILMICPTCRAKVEAHIIGDYPRLYYDADALSEVSGGKRLTLSRCTVCGEGLASYQKLEGYERDILDPMEGRPIWGDAERVFPEAEEGFSHSIPTAIRDSLVEASTCRTAGAYTASVAMTGRALEAIAKHFHTSGDASKLMLARGLQELHSNKIIDDRLHTWGKELHEHRNIATHASGVKFTKNDAEDLLDFGVAICEYVFVVPAKYDEFISRKNARKAAVVSTP